MIAPLLAALVLSSPADSTEHWIFDLMPGEVTIDWSDDVPPRVIEVDSLWVISEGDGSLHHYPVGHFARFMTGPAPADSIDWVFETPSRMLGKQAVLQVGDPPSYTVNFDELPPMLMLDLDRPEFMLQYLNIRLVVLNPGLIVFWDQVNQLDRYNGDEW